MSDQDQTPYALGWDTRRMRYGTTGRAMDLAEQIHNIDKRLLVLQQQKARIDSEMDLLCTMRTLKVAQTPEMRWRKPKVGGEST